MGPVLNSVSGRNVVEDEKTHFGFQTIAESAKEKLGM